MSSPSSSSPRPLDGITVISLEQAVAAPLCTRHLAEMGARVIKIERPGTGDFARHYDERVHGLSSHFVWVNRSKESLTLNLKHPSAMAIMHQLLQEADVLVQNLAPGAADRLGLSFKTLQPTYPQLVVCDISGYGQGGPYETKKAYDLLIQAESGFLSVSGSPDNIAKAGCSVADIAAGMYAHSSILAALMLRDRTNEGSHIDVSMLESAIEWMGFPMYYAFEGATPPPRAGAAHATIYPYGPFAVADGSEVMLGLQNEREWQAFCREVLGDADLVDDPRFASNSLRLENKQALRTKILAAFASLSRDQVIQLLDQAGIANAHVNTMHDVWAHPQLAARDRWTTVDSPAGTLPALTPPANSTAYTPRVSAIPELGAHTHRILTELGYTGEQIQQYASDGVI